MTQKNMKTISINHGSGTGQQELLNTVIIPSLFGDKAGVLEDAALFESPGPHLAFTTDSFVVSPLEFPGGNIGSLAVCGTINDLAMMGARPYALSLGLILEEGCEVDLLQRVLASIRSLCEQEQVKILCGDTKVVPAGKGDGMFINTSGIGVANQHYKLSAANARPGDAVIISGGIGLHGIAIMAARQGLGFASSAHSDCAPLYSLAKALLDAVPDVRAMRDPTRGGCAAVLNEIADASNITITLNESALPVPDVVRGACSFLGLDPLHIANEGKIVAIVPGEFGDIALTALRNHPLGVDAVIIGRVEARGRFGVVMKSVIGGTRLVDVPPGELLPRIC